MSEPYVVPSVLTAMARAKGKPRRLLPGDGVVYHDGEGHQLFGTVVYPGSRRVSVQIAGGAVMPAAQIQWGDDV